jgi:hypothetical protein
MVSSYAHSYDATHPKSRKPRSPSRPSSRKSELERMQRRKWRWRWKRPIYRSETLNRNPRQSRLLHKLNDFDERSSSKRPRSARSNKVVCACMLYSLSCHWSKDVQQSGPELAICQSFHRDADPFHRLCRSFRHYPPRRFHYPLRCRATRRGL